MVGLGLLILRDTPEPWAVFPEALEVLFFQSMPLPYDVHLCPTLEWTCDYHQSSMSLLLAGDLQGA